MDFYKLSPVLSRNAIYNFIVGARGVGKTYSAKEWAIRDFIKNGNQFIYLRRYNTELRAAKATLFADIGHAFPGILFKVEGDRLLVKRGEERGAQWELMGYVIALSKAQQKKSVSYHDVTKIIYDEFIVDRGAIHYIPEEAKVFNDFYSTVDRYKDKTRVLFLANSVSIMNPYFVEYDIRPTEGQEWISAYDGFICTHLPKSEKFTKQVYETRFGSFIKGTEYADYAVGNDFSDNNDSMVGPKTSRAAYTATIETKTGTFSLWIDHSGPQYYVQEKRPKQERIWTLMPDQMAEGKVLIERSDQMLQYLRAGYSRDRVRFSSPQARNAFIGVFKR